MRKPVVKRRRSGRLAAAIAECVESRLLLSTYTVNTLSDSANPGAGLLTLRQAVANANAHTGPDTIAFSTSLFKPGSQHTINLSQGQITFTDTSGATTVNGPGATVATVNAGQVSRIFNVAAGATISISGLTITGGEETIADAVGNTGGGAILNAGTLTLNSSTITGNTVLASGQHSYANNYGGITSYPGIGLGGAIDSTGSLTIANSILSSNSVTNVAFGDDSNSNPLKDGASFGGAVYSVGPLILNNDTITGNTAAGTVSASYSGIDQDGGPAAGGAAYAAGTLTVAGSIISGNSAIGGRSQPSYGSGNSGYASGGGLFVAGALNISISKVIQNSAIGGNSGLDSGSSGPARGGGVYAGADVTISNSTISFNAANDADGFYNGNFSGGGGIYAAATAELTLDTIDNNQVIGSAPSFDIPGLTAGGGGVYAGGAVTILQSSISGNTESCLRPAFGQRGGDSVGGGIDANGGGSISYSTIASNSLTGGHGYDDQIGDYIPEPGGSAQGGGIYSSGSFNSLTITNSTIAENSAIGGGGGNSDSENNNFPSNGGNAAGGGIFASSLSLDNSTITGNTTTAGSAGQSTDYLGDLFGTGSPGAAAAGGITVTFESSLENSIISGNTSDGVFDDLRGHVLGADVINNLIGVGQGPGNDVFGNKVGIDNPQLAPLGDYGGPTETMPPLPGSPAIDSGDNDSADGLSTDQRGLPRIFNSTVDIGAVESQPVGTKLTGTTIGTTGSYRSQGNTSSKALDGNLTTFFDAPDATGDWAGLDLGSAKQITSISFAPRTSWNSRMIGGMFQASNSANFSSGVVTLYAVTSAPPSGTLTNVAIDNPVAYRYVRYIGPANSYCDIAEVQFFGNTPAKGATLTADGTLVVNGSESADNITVDLVGFGVATVSIDSSTQTFADGVEQLIINAGAGNDTVLVDGNDVGLTDSSIVPVTINGGNGNDNLTTHIFTPGLQPMVNHVYLDGGAGNDFLDVSNDGLATLIGGDGDDTFDSNGNPNTLLESVYGGDGNDTLLADGNTGYSIYDGGAGSNTIDYNTNGPASSPPGLTSLSLSGSFLTNVNTVIATDLITSIVANNAGDTIYYPDAGEDGVTITGGAGNDTITVNDAGSNSPTPAVINGNGGDDTITVTNSQNISINGGAGNDTIHTRGDDAVFIDGGPDTDTAYTDPGATVVNVEILNPDLATKLTGTIIGTAGSFQNDGNTISKVFDGNLATFFDAPTANGNSVGLDLGSPKDITQISYAPRSGWASRMVGGIFQGSNNANFSTAVTLYTITAAPVAGQLTTVPIANITSFRYVRYLAPAGSFGNIAELQFFGNPVAQFTGAVIGTTGSYHNQGNTAANVFDSNLNTFFDAPDASGDWVGLDLGSAKIVTQVEFTPRPGLEGRMKGGQIQASNSANFSSGVVTLYTIPSTPTAGTLTTISLTNTTAYRYYRYIGPANSYCNISELELDG